MRKGINLCKLISIQTNHNTLVEIADIKKKYIENIIDKAPICNKISAIILFGSSLEERCTEKSDIDIAIISDYTIGKLCKIKSFNIFTETIYKIDMSQDYDILYFKSLEEVQQNKNNIPICNELTQKGKIIYRRIS